jgi:7,8-dihydro-6-hydroxymethylpterin-pyrophosphokinase
MRERAFVMVPLAEIAPDFVGDLSQYDFVDDVAGVVKLDLTFEDVLKSYKETE